MKAKITRKCGSCGSDITNKVQVYPREGGVLCEQCNWRIGEEQQKSQEKS